jgi:hypothetical protein
MLPKKTIVTTENKNMLSNMDLNEGIKSVLKAFSDISPEFNKINPDSSKKAVKDFLLSVENKLSTLNNTVTALKAKVNK